MDKLRLLVFFMLASTCSIAQQAVSGTVSSAESGESLIGVTVLVKGTSVGTVSNNDGIFSIEANPNDTLVFNYVGYTSLEHVVTGLSDLQIILQANLLSLESVVVVGYGSVKKKDLTGAVSQITAEDIEQRNVSSLTEAIEGTMPGVQVSSFSGAPGSGSFVSIRGISTLNNNNVLWVVDGMPLTNIDFLSPQDIASIQVLKDASSAAIYGAQAANGVIIVETKKGRKGEVKINYNGRYGIQSVSRAPQLANATEYARIQNQGVLNDGGSTPPYDDPESLGAGTDWWDASTQTASVHDHYLSLTKGDEDFNIASSFSYYNQDGILKGGDYERITFRLNTDFRVNDKIRIGENFTFSNQNTKVGLDDYLVWDAMRLEPVTPILLPDYELSGQNEFSIYSPTITDVPNLGGQLARNINNSNSFRTVGNLFFEYTPLPVLKFRSEFGVELENWEYNWYSPDYYIEETDKNDENSVGATFGNKFIYNWNNILTYTKSFGDHDLMVMGAITTRSDTWNSISGSGRNVPNNHEDLRYIQATTSAWSASSSNSRFTNFSYLGRLTYDYMDRYLLSASIRRDGSSRFPTSNQYATFSSVGLGWVISEESFWRGMDWFDFLKVRGAWGQIGNDNIPADAQFTTIDNYYYIQGPDQSLTLGKAPSQIGNTGLIWETVEDFNLGLDATFFDGKLRFVFDAFQRNSTDMLMQKALLSYMGAGFGRQWANIGSMSTKGYEFGLEHKNKPGAFGYSIGINVTNSRSTLDQLADGEAIWEGNDQRLGLLTYSAEGGTVGAFYGFVTDGIFQNETEINSHTNEFGSLIQPSAKPGDFRFKDLNNDGMLTAEGDRMIIGNPEADFTFGINLGINYKGFDLKALFTGSVGNDLMTPIWAYTNSGSSNYNSYSGLINDAWNGEGSTNTQPRIANIDPNQNFRYSDYYISDGSYIRLKNIQIGYSLSPRLLDRLNLSSLRVYVSAENLFTITGYEGLDPDVGPYYSNVLLRGVNWGNYPLPRVISFGLNTSF